MLAGKLRLVLLALALLAIKAMLQVTGYARGHSWLHRMMSPGNFHPPPATIPSARELADRVRDADVRYSLSPGDCLSTSLLLSAYLRRHGYNPEVFLGVRTITGTFESHAWVAVDGVVLNDAADVAELYTPIRRLSAAPDSHSTA